MAENLIEIMAAMHDLDVDDVGLGDLGRREGYVERQLARWSKQWESSKTRELPAVDEVAAALSSRVPEQQGVGVVHGDFRFGNCITDAATGEIKAVLDWELCTLGDPLADLGYLGVFWADNDGTGAGGGATDPTSAGGFGSFSDAVERYAKRSKRDLRNVNFYVAFQLWRSAIIMEGVYNRYVHGAMADATVGDDMMAVLAQASVVLSERAHDALTALP
jgi:aminoglycoside phosphotransferase (APT) family kinase protein